MIENIEVLCHSSIKLNSDKVIYIDPFKIKTNCNDADIIFITHDHYDHYSEEDIEKIRKKDTIIIVPKALLNKVLKLGFERNCIITVEPNKNYVVERFKFETIPAYNINKQFHPKEKEWVGYIIEIKGIRYYIAGDTDITEENQKARCDVAFIPIGGTYTMDFKEAAYLVNEIKPKITIPVHYGEIVGTKQDAIEFAKLINPEIECKIII